MNFILFLSYSKPKFITISISKLNILSTLIPLKFNFKISREDIFRKLGTNINYKNCTYPLKFYCYLYILK